MTSKRLWKPHFLQIRNSYFVGLLIVVSTRGVLKLVKE
ncbi:unnamed protein product [Strongylus vulgaris]|uniref:Uncharacterized protein n=1 Tax=Strongylus vulgaris TaxID=40348 RepID=A0A3P7IL75_STRVU|nr:unnamed protein product [Strongylus vulgaris]